LPTFAVASGGATEQLRGLREIALAIRQNTLDVFPLYASQTGNCRARSVEFVRNIRAGESLIATENVIRVCGITQVIVRAELSGSQAVAMLP
jgi:hypothetical protein